MDFIDTIADTIFGWCLDANAANYGTMVNSGSLSWVLIFLVLISLVAPLVFYYGISKVAANATKKNYILVLFVGWIVLLLANFVIVPTIVDDWSYAFDLNNIVLSLVDSGYYVVLFGIISWLVKDRSNGKYVHLLNAFN